MKIGIIGGGFTGLAAAYELTKQGHAVTVFEKENVLGGLAHGFKNSEYWNRKEAPLRQSFAGHSSRRYTQSQQNSVAVPLRSSSMKSKSEEWEWPLEFAYHHLFTNDSSILSLIKELGMDDSLIVKRPATATYYNGSISQLDSPATLLRYNQLPLADRIRTGAVMAACKLIPFWQPLENYTAEAFFRPIFGAKSWKVIWEPLLYGKFGDLAPRVAASWLWARIHKRTTNLVYIQNGFQTLVERLAQAIKTSGGKILMNTSATSIQQALSSRDRSYGEAISTYEITSSSAQRRSPRNDKLIIHWSNKSASFDKVLLTAPTPIAIKLIPNVSPTTYNLQLSIPHLHAQLLILETKEPILKDIYWLNMNDRKFPFLAVVAHTNLIDPSHYRGHHLTYFGNYLPQTHPFLTMNKEQLLKKFLPFIKKLSPSLNTKYSILNTYLFTGPYAQPVHEVNYSRKAPPLVTPIPNLYLANMDSIYPWDRGTNYAVELGIRSAQLILQ